MALRKADGPLAVHVPPAGADHPSWTRVGVIAALGFVVGVAWPRLVGVRLGPSVPASSVASVASTALAPATAPGAVAPAAVAAAMTASASPAAPPPAAPVGGRAAAGVTVGRGSLFACRTTDGDTLKGRECGGLAGLDDVVVPRLRKLADCPEAAGASGKLRLVVHPDFARGGVDVELARNQGVGAPAPLLACSKAALAGVALAGIPHENPRYSVLYVASFGGVAAAGPDEESAPIAPGASGGSARVKWEVAVVRDAPRTGKIVARLQRGTDVRVGPLEDGWYPVKYGDGFAGEGWVYRGALGR